MHRRTLKRGTFNASMQKIKAPEHFARLHDYEDNYDDSSSHFQFPTIQRKKSSKDANDSASSWGRNSVATSVSWSPEMEDVATWKLIQQWDAVERTLYEDGHQVSHAPVLEECIHWRTQIPHLRIIGKNPFLYASNNLEDLSVNSNHEESNFDLNNDEIFLGYTTSATERKGSSKQKLPEPQNDVLEILLEYVISELFPNKENETKSFQDDISGILKICPAPVYSKRSSANSTRINWLEKTNPLTDRLSNNRILNDNLTSLKKGTFESNTQASQRKCELTSSNSERSAKLTIGNKLHRSQTCRNKLGTVFNEKVVVSSVPYVQSTRESFSTLKTTPIKFMGQSLEVTAFKGKNISYMKNSAKWSTALRISNCQSAWHAPVSPAVWPKNIKLAPIDTSRLPSSKNRLLAQTPTVLKRNRQPLSPIPRSTLPVSAQTIRNNNNEVLGIQGKHIATGQSSRVSLLSAGWDYSPRITKDKKKERLAKK